MKSSGMDVPLPDFNEGHSELEELRDRVTGLPVEDPCEALIDCFGHALAKLTRSEIERLRGRVVMHFGEGHSFVEIIDGHVALRDITGAE